MQASSLQQSKERQKDIKIEYVMFLYEPTKSPTNITAPRASSYVAFVLLDDV